MAKHVLILAGPGDLHAFAVREALCEKGAQVTLWHTPDFPSRSGETVLFEKGTRTITVEGPELALTNPCFQTVWRRRPSHAIEWKSIHVADRKFVEVECAAFRRSLFSLIAPEAFWVNRPEAAIQAGFKMLQHNWASELGFATPDTLYSNNPDQIRTFIRRQGGTIVYKPLRGVPWQDADSVWMPYTNLLTEAQLVEDHLLRSAPGIYQELIPKAYELRITVMGRSLLSAKILSQDMEGGELDWRRVPDDLKMEPYALRSEIADRCFALISRLGLVFGCFDFIVTPNGDYVFLEVNEMGQFLFLEPLTDLPLLDQFSDFLLSGKADFNGNSGNGRIRYEGVADRARAAMAEAETIHSASPEPAFNEG